MDLKQLKKVYSNGGATLTSQGLDFVGSGYMVSAKDGLKLAIMDFSKKTILSIINGLLSGLKDSEYLGLWLDNGYLYIDFSKNYKSKKTALKVAEKKNQLAIYDLENQVSIYLK